MSRSCPCDCLLRACAPLTSELSSENLPLHCFGKFLPCYADVKTCRGEGRAAAMAAFEAVLAGAPRAAVLLETGTLLLLFAGVSSVTFHRAPSHDPPPPLATSPSHRTVPRLSLSLSRTALVPSIILPHACLPCTHLHRAPSHRAAFLHLHCAYVYSHCACLSARAPSTSYTFSLRCPPS